MTAARETAALPIVTVDHRTWAAWLADRCESCHGTDTYTAAGDCETCAGAGGASLSVTVDERPGRRCPKCDGRGSWPGMTRQVCPQCSARRIVDAGDTFAVAATVTTGHPALELVGIGTGAAVTSEVRTGDGPWRTPADADRRDRSLTWRHVVTFADVAPATLTATPR